jgi:molybdopterin synthase catalytic subunit
MTALVCEVLLTEKALVSPDEIAGEETGAIVDFWGVVRRTEEQAEISGIEYEAHQVMAEHQLRVIAEEGADRFDLTQIVVHHRVGFVPVGEASLLVRVASRHRAAAFRAAQWLVDELKKRAPIWKHPQFVAKQTVASSPA